MTVNWIIIVCNYSKVRQVATVLLESEMFCGEPWPTKNQFPGPGVHIIVFDLVLLNIEFLCENMSQIHIITVCYLQKKKLEQRENAQKKKKQIITWTLTFDCYATCETFMVWTTDMCLFFFSYVSVCLFVTITWINLCASEWKTQINNILMCRAIVTLTYDFIFFHDFM